MSIFDIVGILCMIGYIGLFIYVLFFYKGD